MTSAARRLVAAALAVLTLAGCGQPTNPTNPRSTVSATAVKTGDPTLRHDLEPLTKRFPALRTPEAATWLSGTFSGGAPGPSSYWIDAVVRLDAATGAELLAAAGALTPGTPEVVAGLAGSLPAGGLGTSDALNRALAAGEWRAKGYLTADGRTLVLVAAGQ